MDNDFVTRQFEKIETKVEQLIKTCRRTETANAELKSRVDELERELQAKSAEISRYTRERELVNSKIGNILSKLDEIHEEEDADTRD